MAAFVADARESGLVATEARLGRWCREKAGAAQLEAQRNLKELSRERAAVVAAREQLAAAEEMLGGATALSVQARELAQATEAQQKGQEQRAGAVTAAMVEMEAACSARERALAGEQRSAAERHRQMQAELLQPAAELLNIYRQRLGLSVDRTAPGTTRWTFRELVPGAGPCGFTLGVAGSGPQDAYAVGDVQPPLVEAPALAEQLNMQSADPVTRQYALAAFLCAMRRGLREALLRRQSAAVAA